MAKPKHMLKPQKFDRQTSFKTFWAPFTNCAEHNQWTRAQKLAYLRSSLDKEAASVLWDYGKEVSDSLSSLTKTLQVKFGCATFADKGLIELGNQRQKGEETLLSLHNDIQRLAALALPAVRLLSGRVCGSRPRTQDIGKTTRGFRFGTLVGVTTKSLGRRHGETLGSNRKPKNQTEKNLRNHETDDQWKHHRKKSKSKDTSLPSWRTRSSGPTMENFGRKKKTDRITTTSHKEVRFYITPNS